jgi:biotin transport system substrate-specific component
MKKTWLTTRELCFAGIFTAIIAVCAQISIPLSPVPVSMQTFAIALAGIVLGTKNGTIATVVYILLGAVGAPVFARFTGGMGIVLGPTGGFILSFPIIAITAGIGAKTGKLFPLAAWLLAGAIVNYICGTLYFASLMSVDIPYALTVCVLPFIPGDVLKFVLAVVLGRRIKKAI